tara:strand:- start:1666 stop:3036 length:1371 start_codon:yes stop_codon:yes gene_type:complete
MKLPIRFNFIKISTYIYLSLFIFLFGYTLFRAEFIHEGNQFSYYYKYYLIFIFGIIFWLITLFFNEKRKLKIILISTSILFFLYFYESIRFYEPIINEFNFIKNIKEYSKKTEPKIKSKIDIINELKIKKGINAVPSIFPKALFKINKKDFEKDIFPLGGIANKVTVFCKEGDEYSIYKSDRYGFNNPDNEWETENIEWLLLGDSFTQGSCVKPGEDIASQIRFFSKKKAISLGMAGNGPLIELATLKEYGYKKKPKIVLWLYFERNDLEDLAEEKNNPIFIKYLRDDFSQNLTSKQNEINEILNKYIKIEKENLKDKNIILNGAFNKIIRLKIIRDKLALDRGLDFGIDPLFKKIFINAKDFINKWNGKLYFVYLPEKERYTKNNIIHNEYLKKSRVIKLIEDLNIPIIDIHNEFFMKQEDPLSFFPYRIYGHYNAEGYMKISELIVSKVLLNLN